MTKKIVLLGSGELGKELTISLKRLGHIVIACDSYDNAPAMQVADYKEVCNMLNAADLENIINKWSPDIIIPEIEAIRTEKLFEFEKKGIQVVPSAKAVNYTMNRKAIRDLASVELGLKTAKYQYATSLEELTNAVNIIGMPCVVKPLMSSSGKGQSIIKTIDDITNAWHEGTTKGRGDVQELIVEEFIDFDYEITLLTVTTFQEGVFFAPPIGHVQKNGDYQESFQPVLMKDEHFKEACQMAEKITTSLTGAGLWGVEFFVSESQGVYFSELSPRPHDTGMVTLAHTQNLTEFELHARAVLNLPINHIKLEKKAASHVILSGIESNNPPLYSGIEKALMFKNTDLRIFAKPTTRINRRMGVILSYGDEKETLDEVRKRAKESASCVMVV